MDEATIKQNLETLKEIILDEKRCVTYVSLSKELCIHTNLSKLLLKRFAEDMKITSESKLNICYLLSGLSNDNNAHTIVCSEKDIQDEVKKLKTVFFQHIYSICTGLSEVDSVSLTAVNNLDDFPLSIGLVKNYSCSKRTNEEMSIMKANRSPVKVDPPQRTASLPAKVKEVKRENTEQTIEPPRQVKSEPIIKNEPSPKKDNKTATKQNNKTQKGISGFFSKQVGSDSKKPIETKVDKSNVKTKNVLKVEEPSIKSEKVLPESQEEEMEVDVEIPETPTRVKVSSSSRKVNSKSKQPSKPEAKASKGTFKETSNKSKKTTKVDKNRKRVLQVSDSESEDDKDPFCDETLQETQESEDEIPPTPNTNIVKVTSATINPRKRRKIVDKTYTDEDGYILTKKEEVYESCSDNEVEVDVKENVKVTNQIKKEISPKDIKKETKSRKKVTPPQKGKQSTMMSFFKKM